MRRLDRPLVLGAVLAAAIAACSTTPTSSGPGTASLDIAGRRGACHSIGGCAYVVRLAGPDGQSEAGFEPAPVGPDLVLGEGLPPVVTDGDYRLTFELRFMSDVIANDAPRAFGVGATCETSFTVGPGRAAILVRVTFGVGSCSVSMTRSVAHLVPFERLEMPS